MGNGVEIGLGVVLAFFLAAVGTRFGCVFFGSVPVWTLGSDGGAASSAAVGVGVSGGAASAAGVSAGFGSAAVSWALVKLNTTAAERKMARKIRDMSGITDAGIYLPQGTPFAKVIQPSSRTWELPWTRDDERGQTGCLQSCMLPPAGPGRKLIRLR
jgi:hypothetical protein